MLRKLSHPRAMFKQALSKVGGTVDDGLLERMGTAAKYGVEQRLACSLCVTVVMRRMEGNVTCVCLCLHCIKSQNNIHCSSSCF